MTEKAVHDHTIGIKKGNLGSSTFWPVESLNCDEKVRVTLRSISYFEPPAS